VGELYIGGPGLAQGYLGRPDLTAERFIPHPFSQEQGARLYRSGDLARFLPNGDIDFLGRADDQVKIRGFRIELGEIEAVLKQHPAVKEAVVLAREVAHGDNRLAAFVVSKSEQPIIKQSLRKFLQEALPDHMVPPSFVFLSALPLTPNGKVDRAELSALPLSGSEPQEGYASPRNSVEELLADIWAQCLDVEPPGIHDNFFYLGGHSLLVNQLLSNVSDLFQMELPTRAFLEAPTIADLADALERHEPKPGQVATIARLRKQVRALSDDELQVLLQEQPQAEGLARHES
jgi:acyl carrier protein